jgi:hypothetical protein
MKQNMQRHLLRSVLVAAAGLLLGASAVLAHHSQSAEFDRNRTIEFTGIVQDIGWTNPHGYVLVEAEDPDGNLVVYKVEIQAPNQLYRAGWRRDSLKPGTEVSFEGNPSRDSESMNVSGPLAMPDGTAAFRGSGPAAR